MGYARCSTVLQDLTAQREILVSLGVPPDRIYLGKGLTGTSRGPLAVGVPRRRYVSTATASRPAGRASIRRGRGRLARAGPRPATRPTPPKAQPGRPATSEPRTPA